MDSHGMDYHAIRLSAVATHEKQNHNYNCNTKVFVHARVNTSKSLFCLKSYRTHVRTAGGSATTQAVKSSTLDRTCQSRCRVRKVRVICCHNTAINLAVPLLVHRAHHCCQLTVRWLCSKLEHAPTVCGVKSNLSASAYQCTQFRVSAVVLSPSRSTLILKVSLMVSVFKSYTNTKFPVNPSKA